MSKLPDSVKRAIVKTVKSKHPDMKGLKISFGRARAVTYPTGLKGIRCDKVKVTAKGYKDKEFFVDYDHQTGWRMA